MSITEYIENSIFRKNNSLSVLIMGPLLLGYLFLYPNLILHFSEFTKYLIKYPVMISILLVTAILGVRSIGRFWPLLLILPLLIFNYMLVQTNPATQFLVQATTLLLLAGMFYRYPGYMGLYFKIGIFVAVIFSVQTMVVFLFWLGNALGLGIRLPVEPVIFQGETTARNLNIYLGADGWRNVVWWAGFRATSYFTEAARYAFFLTPFLYVTAYLRKQSSYYAAAFVLIGLNILLTFSVAAWAAIAVTYFLFRYNTLSKKVSFVMTLIFILIPAGLLVYMLYPVLWHQTFDKSGSAEVRLFAMAAIAKVVSLHQAGCDTVEPLCADIGPAITWAPLFWLVFSGVQGLFFMFLMVMYYVFILIRIVGFGGGLERALAYGGIAVLLEQTWWGDYLEFPFIGFFSILIALAAIRRKLTKKYGPVE